MGWPKPVSGTPIPHRQFGAQTPWIEKLGLIITLERGFPSFLRGNLRCNLPRNLRCGLHREQACPDAASSEKGVINVIGRSKSR